jgi:hypothetical protein
LTSKENGTRFGAPVIGALFSGLVQALPDIVAAFAGRAREIQLNWINFVGERFPDGDTIHLDETDLGDPNVIEIELHQPYNTWWKGVEVFVGDTMIERLYVWDSNRDAGPVRINVNDLIGGGNVIFNKAKFLGIHTRMYVIAGLDQKRGKRMSFSWLDD